MNVRLLLSPPEAGSAAKEIIGYGKGWRGSNWHTCRRRFDVSATSMFWALYFFRIAKWWSSSVASYWQWVRQESRRQDTISSGRSCKVYSHIADQGVVLPENDASTPSINVINQDIWQLHLRLQIGDLRLATILSRLIGAGWRYEILLNISWYTLSPDD